MTPFSLGQAMAGIEIHANALDTILTQKYLKKATAWLTSFFVLAFGLSNSLFFSLLRRFWLAGLASVLALLAYLLLALIYFERGLIFDLVYPILAWGLSLLAVLFFQYFSEAQEKKYLKRSFQYYLAPAVVKEIIKDPASLKLGGQKKDVTIMFADLRNFTSLSEKLAPEVLVSLLNEYFTAMAEIILAEGGVLDKFIGDAIMAFWGAPQETKDHSQRACRVALAMVKKLAELDKTWVSSGKPPLEVGIGINTGQVVVGNMGSEKRFDYTVIGDHVNLASRLEGLNKSYGTKIIISEFTKARVENEFILRPLDEVKVKGKEIPVEIFELIGEKS